MQACGLVANVIVIFITWYRTKDIIFVGKTSAVRSSLASSMLQSGTSQFPAFPS